MKFTDAALAALAAPEGQSEYFVWDESLPGFGARVRRLSTRFVIQYRITGNKTRRELLGDIRRISIADARKIAKRRFAQAEMGEDPAAAKAKAKAEALAQQLTLGVAADRYLALKQSTLRASTHQAATRYYTKHWGPLRNRPLAEVTRAEIARVLQDLTIRHGRVSAARARSALSTLFVWAMRQGLAESNPAANTEDPSKGIPARERILNDDEIRTVWNACLPDDFGRIVKLLLLTGCRREEIGGLLWSEVNLDTGVMTIPGARTKGHRELRLSLAPVAIEILREVSRRDGRVFERRGGWNNPMAALHKRIAADIGEPLPHWTLHDLRRTMRSGLGRLGIAPHVSELTIGHARVGVQAIYDRHTYAPEIKAALAVWADHVLAIVEGKFAQVVPLRA